MENSQAIGLTRSHAYALPWPFSEAPFQVHYPDVSLISLLDYSSGDYRQMLSV